MCAIVPTSDVLGRAGRVLVRTARAAGLDLRQTARFPAGAWRYIADLRAYRRALHEISPGHPLALHPVLADATSQAGRAQGHYFHQDLWAARKLIDTRPSGHVDVGSRIDGFVAHLLAAGLTVTVVDLRPLIAPVEGLRFVRDDAMSMRSFDDGSIASLSCLHALEHFGLGRYGDPIDPLGWERACDAFSRILHEGGRLLVSVPVGRERTEFNADRVSRLIA